jgi:hypothetical protein
MRMRPAGILKGFDCRGSSLNVQGLPGRYAQVTPLVRRSLQHRRRSAAGPLAVDVRERPHADVGEATPITSEQMRKPVTVIPPVLRPSVLLRYCCANELLVSGLLDQGSELAQHAAVICSPYGDGHVVPFSNNPF